MANFDEAFGDLYLSALDGDGGTDVTIPGFTPPELQAVLRRITSSHIGKVLPVLCGSAYRNKVCYRCLNRLRSTHSLFLTLALVGMQGIQPLLDAVVAYLPSPVEVKPAVATIVKNGESALVSPDTHKSLCALAFKVCPCRVATIAVTIAR